ncbi:hypothetical protein D3C83_195550 [compost metagenome]
MLQINWPCEGKIGKSVYGSIGDWCIASTRRATNGKEKGEKYRSHIAHVFYVEFSRYVFMKVDQS